MNPFLNPINMFTFLKNIYFDKNRIFKLNYEELKKYQDKSLRKVVQYAYTVPLYHKKYKKEGIHPSDIRKVEDIKKLPFISKDDIRNGYPRDILPFGANRNKQYMVCTGGTTGKPIRLFTDFKIMSKNTALFLRDMKILGLNGRDARIAHLGNFSENRYDLVTENNFTKYLKKFIRKNNSLNIDVNNPIKEILEKLDEFQPDVIYSYPAIYQHLAYLKRKGNAENLRPKICLVGGAILDNYTKSYVEDSFDCRMLNFYSSVEASGDIGLQCLKNTWHIHSDYYYLEAIDENNNVVSPGKRGHIAITRLFVGGTPIIRYVGMDDWIKVSSQKTCSCGLTTPVIEKLEGRKRANIVLPNGKIFPPGAFCFISPVLHKLNTFKVKQYQIIQNKINEIEILLVIDKELENKGPSFKKISDNIKKVYHEKCGPDVNIIIRQVDEIVNKKNKRKPAPIVVSHINSDEEFEKLNK